MPLRYIAGHNVHTIAIEVPMAMIENGSGVIGAYGFTTRPRITIRNADGTQQGSSGAARVQVQRLANPLVNELIIGTRSTQYVLLGTLGRAALSPPQPARQAAAVVASRMSAFTSVQYAAARLSGPC